MSAPLRFLSVAILGWAALRATTLGALPGFTVSYAKPVPPPPLVPSELQAPAPAFAATPSWPDAPAGWSEPLAAAAAAAPGYRSPAVRLIPYYLPAYAPAQSHYLSSPIADRPPWRLASSAAAAPTMVPAGAAVTYSELPSLIPAVGVPQRSVPVSGPPGEPRLDRWQMSSWAVLRGPPAPGALVSGGTLGGSQAGARVIYAFSRSLAASLRATSPIGGSTGAEIAGGIRWAPLRSLPVAITAERRQSISPYGGGRSDFALFVEGGVYRQRMPWRFELDAYAQAGAVGISKPDFFADGAMAFTRPIYGRFSAGLGMWGGYQPGLYRLDAGPRISMRVRDNIRAHVDWRQRIVGNAQPASGPALTLAADF